MEETDQIYTALKQEMRITEFTRFPMKVMIYQGMEIHITEWKGCAI